MANEVYFQSGAVDSGKSEASPQMLSAEASPPSGVTQEVNGNEPVTRELLNKMRQEIEESVLRKTQSMTDKLGSKLDMRIKSAQDEAEKAIKMAKASGVTLTPEQERNISQTAVNDALAARDDSPVETRKASPDIDSYVDKEVRKIMTQTGVYLDPEEANQLIGTVDTPFDYLRKFEQICSERSNSTAPESRIPTLAQGGKPLTVDALKQQYKDEIALINSGKHPNIRRGDWKAVTDMKQAYRKKGVDVG